MINTKPLALLGAAIFISGGLLATKGRLGTQVKDHYYVPAKTTEWHPAVDTTSAALAVKHPEWTGKEGAGSEMFTPHFVSPSDSVAMGAWLSHSRITRDRKTVHAAIAVRARPTEIDTRPPLNLSLVIDVSGSMEGEKLVQAQAAAHALVDSLDHTDRLGVVSFSDEAQVESPLVRVTRANRKKLHAAISALRDDAGTNLYAGLELGRDLLAGPEPGAVSRVMLLSDGRASVGNTSYGALRGLADRTREAGVSVTTMGVGLDYDDHIMHAIANTAAGNYYFIDSAEQTRPVLDKEFASLAGTVARNVELALRPGAGVRIVDFGGFAHRKKGGAHIITLDALTAGARKDLLIELAIDTKTSDWMRVLDSKLSFLPMRGDIAGITIERSVHVGADEEVNLDVLRRVQQIETIRAFEHAMRVYESGQRFKAADIVDAQREANETFLKTYKIEDAAFRRVAGEMRSLAQDLRRTQSHSTRGRWIKKQVFKNAQNAAHSQIKF